MKIFFLFIALFFSISASAEITPPRGSDDPRVRILDYNPMDVIKITTFYGVSTHIKFGEDESVNDIAAGDDQAWKIIPRGNHLYVKPVAINPDTNLTVTTNKRTYQFTLVVLNRPQKDSTAWTDPNLVFSLKFRYPEEEEAKKIEIQKREGFTAQLNQIKIDLSKASKESYNTNYWIAGSEEISPTSARDDGRFTYLTFSNNRDMPAIYSVDTEGNESLINTNVIDGNVIVIQRLVPRLMLRKGGSVVSIINKSFDLNGGTDNATGTISPYIERIIKGEK